MKGVIQVNVNKTKYFLLVFYQLHLVIQGSKIVLTLITVTVLVGKKKTEVKEMYGEVTIMKFSVYIELRILYLRLIQQKEKHS